MWREDFRESRPADHGPVLNLWLQGEAEDELPEKMIGSARIVRPDLGRAEALDW